MDVGLNKTDCIIKTLNLGGTTVNNICSGEKEYIPYGAIDYVVFAGLSSVVVAFIILIISASIFVLSDE